MDARPTPRADEAAERPIPFTVRVPATRSLPARRLRTLKCGDLFGLFGPEGDVAPGPGSPEGLYWRDTRILSRFALALEGHAPLLLSSRLTEDGLLLLVDLANPDLVDPSGCLAMAADSVHLLRLRVLTEDGMFERLRLQSYEDRPRRLELAFELDADFADIFEVRGHVPAARGERTVEVLPDGLRWRYLARDGARLEVGLVARPRPARVTPARISWRLELPPRAQHCVELALRVDGAPRPPPSFARALHEARRHHRRLLPEAARIATSSSLIDEIFARARADLRLLLTETPHGLYPYAGVPWFSTVFGRDGIVTALETLWMAPELARGVLEVLAATQAREVDPARDAEPGKILHELRDGELARLGEVPFGRYYGSVDATPLFVLLAGRYHQRTGDDATLRRLWPAILAALAWIERFGDRDGDGFVEYGRGSERGLVNQGWKDSEDAVFHADGTLARGPVALVEVQAYVFAALVEAARLARHLGEHARASALEDRARALRLVFEERFWSEELGSYVLALDGDKRPCAVRTSNAGHALFTGIAAPERAAKVAELLCSPRFFSGWGIRTVAEGEARYVPISYHNGSVWPHDNALLAMGFARIGRTDLALRVFQGLLDAAARSDLRRLPELFCGFRRRPGSGPTAYPAACSPQAWAAGAVFACLGAVLGLEIEAEPAIVRLRHPRLPASLDWVRIEGLAVGSGSVDLLLRRHDHDVAVNLLARSGEVEVQVVL
ncbi:MAG: amylo-alpha-1,6-glucosidase [Geminicoccaceae bacterium]|nr:amylo-alpha-1,6-glucosidase [Geminicoccaceae bacterium]